MKKLVLLVCVSTIPVFLFLNAWQAYRYGIVAREVASLERQQHEWIEKNRRTVAGIGSLASPARIREIARRELGLRLPAPEKMTRIIIDAGTGRRDG